jgi:hypothetical protein
MKTTIPRRKHMVTILFTGTKLLILDVLPSEQKCKQDDFVAMTAP